jgi:hypothetical protein
MMKGISASNIPIYWTIVVRIPRLDRLQDNQTYFTGPRLLRVVFVSASRGVDAKIHTPPALSWMAVDLPPSGTPKRVKGLYKYNE